MRKRCINRVVSQSLLFGGGFGYRAPVDVSATDSVFSGALQAQFRITQRGGQVFFSAIWGYGDNDAA